MRTTKSTALRISALYRNARDDHRLCGPVVRAGLAFLYRAHRVHAVYHVTEDRVLGIEKTILGGVDEKLRAVGIGTGIRHRNRADVVFVVRVYLVFECVAGSACAPTSH